MEPNSISKPADATGVSTCWLGGAHAFAFGDGRLLIDSKTYSPHEGGILAIACDVAGSTLLSCGDDGAVIATDSNGQSTTLFHKKGAWLDVMGLHCASKTLAISTGREVITFATNAPSSSQRTYKPARAANALAFSGDGQLLAICHSGGVSLFKTDDPVAPLYELPCSGGPISVAMDHKGGFLFAGLSEPALAGWRLRDGQGFRMGGYPGKPRQLLWTQKEQALLTTGGPALLVWPMIGKDGRTRVGPMGQAAGVYRPRLGMVTALATHGDFALVGWSDGGVDYVNLSDGTSRYLGGNKAPETLDTDPRASTSGIVAIAIRQDGKQASWINETGSYGTSAIQ